MASFGERLKELRLERQLTQEQLSKKFFLNKSSISRYEKDLQIPEMPTLENLSSFFNVSIDYLLGKSNIRNNTNQISSNDTLIPTEFIDASQAREYISRHAIFGSNGFRPDLMSDDEILEFANELLKQMELISYKYRK